MSVETPFRFQKTSESTWDVSVPSRGVIGRIELAHAGRLIRSYRAIGYRPDGTIFNSGKPQQSVTAAANYIYKYWLKSNQGGQNA